MNSLRVAIRADASNRIGMGHVVRCAALAEELRRRGATVWFLCRPLAGDAREWLRSHGFDVLTFAEVVPVVDSHDGVLDGSADAAATRAVLEELGAVDWLVVDSYELDIKWETAQRDLVGKILVIDDLHSRPHDCDILLDQNPQERQDQYLGLVSPKCTLLLGPRYAMLRPAFRDMRNMRSAATGDARLLVFAGGGDQRNLTSKILRALLQSEAKELPVDVVCTRGSRGLDSVKALCQALPRCTLHVQTEDMARLMAQATLMVGAPGSTSWERACLGLPAVLMSVAQNQQGIGRMLARARAALYLGDESDVSESYLASLTSRLLKRPQLLERMRKAALRMVDGRGVQRIAASMIGRLRINVVSDEASWINAFLDGMTDRWRTMGHSVHRTHDAAVMPPADLTFLLSLSRIVPAESLTGTTHSLVVHASPLPEGRGWSPMTWYVLEGAATLTVTLFEANERVDSGEIYDQETIELEGHELIEELRAMVGGATVVLCERFVSGYPTRVALGRPQRGKPSYFARRGPSDSRLDPTRSIAEQFDLLRVVDNDRYPAWFEWRGNRYVLRIEKSGRQRN